MQALQVIHWSIVDAISELQIYHRERKEVKEIINDFARRMLGLGIRECSSERIGGDEESVFFFSKLGDAMQIMKLGTETLKLGVWLYINI